MGKKSIKENKSIYQIYREELGLTRAEASDLLQISDSKLEKIETYKTLIQPEDVITMAEKYNKPLLCNYYCSNECAIGQAVVPEIELKDLPSVTLEILSLLNKLDDDKERLIEISADGEISEDEKPDFNTIKENLDKMSLSIESLKAWVNTMESN